MPYKGGLESTLVVYIVYMQPLAVLPMISPHTWWPSMEETIRNRKPLIWTQGWRPCESSSRSC